MSSSTVQSTGRGRNTCAACSAEIPNTHKYPVATKRVVRAILKATDLCATDPDRAARRLVDGGFTKRYDYALQTLSENPYDKWREYDAEDTIRFYALSKIATAAGTRAVRTRLCSSRPAAPAERRGRPQISSTRFEPLVPQMQHF